MAYTVMSNMSESDIVKYGFDNISKKDINRLRELAKKWMEIASSDEMKHRKSLWRSIHDLKPERPMILFETLSVAGFVTDKDLLCKNKLLKNIETTMVYNIKQFDELNDDIVIESYYRLAWKISKSDYGIIIEEQHAENSLAYISNFPVKTPDDIEKLKKRSFSVDCKTTLALKEKIENIFGDILPVVLGNYDNFFPEIGFTPFVGNNFVGLTMDLFKLIGNENMMLWPYDHPDDLHRLMRYLCDDRISFYNWLKDERLLDFNSDNQFGGPSSYGYISSLPEVGAKKELDLKDLWAWPDSQETVAVSPSMFNEFFLGYIAEVANMFGMSYYACCEPLDDRFDYVSKAIPNLRTVSISAWNDFHKIGEILGSNYVHSKKPNPVFISGKNPDWENMEKDLRDSFYACKNGNMEIIVRDVYDINGDMERLSKWVKMAKSVVGI